MPSLIAVSLELCDEYQLITLELRRNLTYLLLFHSILYIKVICSYLLSPFYLNLPICREGTPILLLRRSIAFKFANLSFSQELSMRSNNYQACVATDFFDTSISKLVVSTNFIAVLRVYISSSFTLNVFSKDSLTSKSIVS